MPLLPFAAQADDAFVSQGLTARDWIVAGTIIVVGFLAARVLRKDRKSVV
jgi:hypothetical protein